MQQETKSRKIRPETPEEKEARLLNEDRAILALKEIPDDALTMLARKYPKRVAQLTDPGYLEIRELMRPLKGKRLSDLKPTS